MIRDIELFKNIKINGLLRGLDRLTIQGVPHSQNEWLQSFSAGLKKISLTISDNELDKAN